MTQISSVDQPNVLMIDNYDSFTWNLYQYLCLLGASVSVVRSQACSLEELIQAYPALTHLVISPGPGHPSTDSGISIPAIHHYAGKIPILGICMGLQCIYSAFGGQVSKVGQIVHGKTSIVTHDQQGLFKSIPQGIQSTRYHSLAGKLGTLPSELKITSWTHSDPDLACRNTPFETQSSIIMGVRHKSFTIESVQYHPESILSEEGKPFLSNFLKLRGGYWSENPDFLVPQPSPSINISNKFVSQTILEKICQQRSIDITHAKTIPGSTPSDLKRKIAANIPPIQIDFYQRTRKFSVGNVALMAEIKRASPSKGSFVTPSTPSSPEIAISYAAAGASVISVLTEPNWFKGTLLDMLEVRLAVENILDRPAILRKDFIIDPYQIDEARCYGADTVLLIVACLSVDKLKLLYNHSKSLGMEPLVEVVNSKELELALQIGARVIGVNNRNLHDFQVDMNKTSQMLDALKGNQNSNQTRNSEVIMCALSGISSRSDVERYVKEGVRAILVGESLMRAEDKVGFVQELLGISPRMESKKRRPLVKICGIKTVEAAVHAANQGADLIGLIFVPKSKRYVSPQQAKLILEAVRDSRNKDSTESSTEAEDAAIEPNTTDWFSLQYSRLLMKLKTQRRPLIVGVFQDASIEEIEEVIDQSDDSIDLIQLHGSEDIRMSKFLSKPVIKAFHVPIEEQGSIVDSNSKYEQVVKKSLSSIHLPGYHSFPMLDSSISNSNQRGGIGTTFNWDFIKNILTCSDFKLEAHHHHNLIIAGGLNQDNILDCIKIFKPFAIDLSSGVELDSFKNDTSLVENKDFVKITNLLRLIKSSDSQIV